jgi:hypothetical protein
MVIFLTLAVIFNFNRYFSPRYLKFFIFISPGGLSIEPDRVCFQHTPQAIVVELDGAIQTDWCFLPFVVDEAHIGCVARGPRHLAVDRAHVGHSSVEFLVPRRDRVKLYELLLDDWPKFTPL